MGQVHPEPADFYGVGAGAEAGAGAGAGTSFSGSVLRGGGGRLASARGDAGSGGGVGVMALGPGTSSIQSGFLWLYPTPDMKWSRPPGDTARPRRRKRGSAPALVVGRADDDDDDDDDDEGDVDSDGDAGGGGVPTDATCTALAVPPTPSLCTAPCLTWFESDPSQHRLRWCSVDLTASGSGPQFPELSGTVFLTSIHSVTPLSCLPAATAAAAAAAASPAVAGRRGHRPPPATPFLFMVRGGAAAHGSMWQLLLQAPTAQDLTAWLQLLRRYVTALAPPLSAPVQAALHAAVCNDRDTLRDLLAAGTRRHHDAAALVPAGGTAAVGGAACRDGAGNTLLAAACRAGSVHVVRWLLRHGLVACDPEAEDVVRRGGVVEAVVAAIEDVNVDGETPLHVAAACPPPMGLAVVQQLLKVACPTRRRLAWINYQALGGVTAVHVAAACRHTATARSLAEAGANLLAVDDTGWTVAHHVAAGRQSGAGPTAAAAVLQPPPDAVDDAVAACARAVVSAAVDAVEAADGGGSTPLHVAATHGRLECLQAFLGCAVEPRCMVNDDGCTPASVAAAHGHTKCVQLLEAYGDAVSAPHAMRLSEQRRAASRHAVAAEHSAAALHRMHRVMSVWEAVLARAMTRVVAPPPLPPQPSARHSDSAAALWCLRLDAASGAHYFVQPSTGESVWAAQAPSLPRDDSHSSAAVWHRDVEPSSGHAYFSHTATGDSVWAAAAEEAATEWSLVLPTPTAAAVFVPVRGGDRSGGGGGGGGPTFMWAGSGWEAVVVNPDHMAPGVWQLATDPASGAPYFECTTTGTTLWARA